MSAPTDRWPYLTFIDNGVRLPFKQAGMLSTRERMTSEIIEALVKAEDARTEARAALDAGKPDESATAHARWSLLLEGGIGWHLMQLWQGPRMPSQERWAEDQRPNTADEDTAGRVRKYRGAYKHEEIGREFAEDLCEVYGLAIEQLARISRLLREAAAPGAPEPLAVEVDGIIRDFKLRGETTA